MIFHYVHVPFVAMRERPAFQSKVVSQALFGEEVQVQEKEDDWLLISTPDRYLGWVPLSSIIKRSEPYSKDLEVTRLSAHIYAVPDTEYGPLMTVPHGSKVSLLDDRDPRWMQIQLLDENRAFIQKGDVQGEVFELCSFSKKFLGLPYTWGGRSSFGFDCSGYVQMLYSRLGVQLPRDAWQQILDPRCKPVECSQLKLGDLIFWGKSREEIKHVGMSLGAHSFIHTSVRENMPYLRISHLTDVEWSGSKEAFYPFRAARRF